MKLRRKILVSMFSIALLAGCTAKDEVSPLMEEGKYKEAYEVIEEEPNNKEYQSKKDEVAFHLAQSAADKEDYDSALKFLQDNVFEGAKELKAEVEKKKVDADFLKDMAKALDERYKDYDARKAEFSKDANLSPMLKELEIIEKYEDTDFYDDELEANVKEYISGVKKQIAAFDQWDTNLFKTSLDALAGNGYRLAAVQKINAKYPLAVEYETTKDTLDSYNFIISEYNGDALQKCLESLTFTRTGGDGEYTYYKMSGKNTGNALLETEKGYDNTTLIYGSLLDRKGNYVGKIWDEGIPTLRPGQEFTLDAFVNAPIGDLKDYWYE